MTALYIHIPFCLSKCPYCSFASLPGRKSLHRPYVEAVIAEMRQTAASQPASVTTLFIGGGTPTVLAEALLLSVIAACRKLFPFIEDGEFTCEANPGALRPKLLCALREAGINRLSLGVQSFDDAELRLLGRLHDAQAAQEAVAMVKEAGFTNFSLDLMYGLPGQRAASWRQNLETALALNPPHLSLYQLTIDDGTPFASRYQPGQPPMPTEEEILAMDALNQTLCGQAGLRQYEISNFARTGYECRHNLTYWMNESYLAVGAAAVSYVEGKRQGRLTDPERYCAAIERGENAIAWSEELSAEAAFRETMVMGLRLNAGVELARLRRRFAIDALVYYHEALTKFMAAGFIQCADGHLCLTRAGRLIANQVLAELV
ncbi:MAG: radical SAM family heme chaperone HemW [Desulfobulbaceae bacterium]|jgi:oxygen-independent coproporphyrinogen-3 oxidase|nr:radical SAM family heme chaperone HemW [Desulfobulbaceae bacterium]